MKQILNLVKLLVKSLLIFAMLWILWGLGESLLRLSSNLDYSHTFFLVGVGFCIGLLIFSLMSTFSRTYIFGHELTHWLMAKLFRRRTSGLKIGKNGGSLHVEKPNIFIVLAPYIFPLYTILWFVLAGLFQVSVKTDWGALMLYAGVGFTYAYHVTMTILAISKNQSDLKMYGHFFSICIILNINVFTLFLGISYFSEDLGTGCSLLKDSFHYQWRILDNFVMNVIL